MSLVVGFDQYSYNGERNIYAPADGVQYVNVARLPIDRYLRTASGVAKATYIPLSPKRVG